MIYGGRQFFGVVLALAAAACQEEVKPRARPVPTPGPQAVVREVRSISGSETVERGERIRFAVIGTGAGTNFGPQTFLNSPAFADLRIVAVVSTSRLLAQGTISVAAGEGNKDLAVVSGDEIALAPWAFDVVPTEVIQLGAPPQSSASLSTPSPDGGVIDPGGDFDLFQFAPDSGAARSVVVRVDRDASSPDDFKPTLEVFDAAGRLAAQSTRRCVSFQVNSRAPWFVRIADPTFQGAPDRRYRLVVDYGQPETCLTANPGDVVP